MDNILLWAFLMHHIRKQQYAATCNHKSSRKVIKLKAIPPGIHAQLQFNANCISDKRLSNLYIFPKKGISLKSPSVIPGAVGTLRDQLKFRTEYPEMFSFFFSSLRFCFTLNSEKVPFLKTPPSVLLPVYINRQECHDLLYNTLHKHLLSCHLFCQV